MLIGEPASPPSDNSIVNLVSLFKNIYSTIMLGFIFGVLFYALPAFALGLIYATLELKKTWKSYILVTLFSPFFLLIFNYSLRHYFPPDFDIPFFIKTDKIGLIYLMCPLSSFSSIIAAWLSFPKA